MSMYIYAYVYMGILGWLEEERLMSADSDVVINELVRGRT